MKSACDTAHVMTLLQEHQGYFDCRLKPVEHFPHGFPLYRESTFAEDYRRGKLSLVLVFRSICVDDVRPVDNRDILYCAVISADLQNVRCLYLGNKQPVFVLKIKAMESVEGITNAIPSLVRLYRIQEFTAEAGDGLLFVSGLDELFKVYPGWEYGKLDPQLLRAVRCGKVHTTHSRERL